MIPSNLFITSTSTNVGKTFVARALARALTIRNYSVFAIKPIETGCDPDPLDAVALGRACNKPALANAPGLYREKLPISPYAASLRTGSPPPDIQALTITIIELCRGADFTLVEGGGGLLAPVDRSRTMADLALALRYPLLVVADDSLGVLSYTLTLAECANQRGLNIAAFVLMQHESGKPYTGPGSNHHILTERFSVPVIAFPHCSDDDDLLAAAADSSRLLRVLGIKS